MTVKQFFGVCFCLFVMFKDGGELIESSKSLFFLTLATKQYKLKKENFTMKKTIQIANSKSRKTSPLHLQPKNLQ
jgi:hypothetical protein